MLACNDESNFVNAKKFDPDRWMDLESKRFKLDLSSSLVVPFGVGKRACPGKRFVELELVALLSKVIKSRSQKTDSGFEPVVFLQIECLLSIENFFWLYS